MPTKSEQKKIVSLYKSGKTQRWIADHLGVSRSTVQRAIAAELRRAPNLDNIPKSRVSKNDPSSIDGPAAIVPPHDHESEWKTLNLDRAALRSLPPYELAEILTSLSPDISRAIWDTLRMIDPGHEVKAYKMGVVQEIDEKAQAALNDFIEQLDERHGSFSSLIAKLSMGAFVRGAFFSELVVSPDGRRPLDIVAPDPISVRFKKYIDPLYGESWELGQQQRGDWVSLEYPTIIYIPIDPMAGSPYGRSPLAPAIFPSVFLLSVMHDLKRVISQQGYVRSHIAVIVDKVRESLALDSVDDLADEIESIIEQIDDAWSSQEPDDTYIHPDYIEVGQIQGAMTVGTNALAGADSLIAALERMLVRSLKSMPIVMGSAEGASEANANRQWEMYMASIQSLQKLLARLLERMFTIALQVQGIQAKVVVTFSQVRASEAYRDAQADLVKVSVAEQAEMLGYMDHDEASMYVTGHAAVADRVPGFGSDPTVGESETSQGESNATTEGEPLLQSVDESIIERETEPKAHSRPTDEETE